MDFLVLLRNLVYDRIKMQAMGLVPIPPPAKIIDAMEDQSEEKAQVTCCKGVIVMKRFLTVVLACIMLAGCSTSIGTVEGPEWDVITIDGVEYIKAPDEYDIYSSADKDDHLGIIKSGDQTLGVYTIKGDTDQNFLYVRWEWEGGIYVRKDYVAE